MKKCVHCRKAIEESVSYLDFNDVQGMLFGWGFVVPVLTTFPQVSVNRIGRNSINAYRMLINIYSY